jgi:hypothetical protein
MHDNLVGGFKYVFRFNPFNAMVIPNDSVEATNQ